MQKIHFFLVVLLGVALLTACTPKTKSQQLVLDQKWHSAKAICFEQAQDMTNSTVSMSNPDTNDYFRSCMRTRFGYTNQQITDRGY